MTQNQNCTSRQYDGLNTSAVAYVNVLVAVTDPHDDIIDSGGLF